LKHWPLPQKSSSPWTPLKWKKSVALLGTSWGTHWELDGNTLGTAKTIPFSDR
jgi:hypothetical protein